MDIRYVHFVFCIAFVLHSIVSAHAQSRHDFRPVVRIDANGFAGTGFIVAKKSGLCEIWTNAHVAGPEGEAVTIRFFDGQRVTGTVAWSRLDRSANIDAAKIIAACPDNFVVSPLVVGYSSRTNSIGIVDGWPLGRWQVSKPIRKDKRGSSFGTSYQPISFKGESGSPVTDTNTGKVIGVSTWNVGPERRPLFSAFQPIENWTGEDHSVEISFDFEYRPIGIRPSE